MQMNEGEKYASATPDTQYAAIQNYYYCSFRHSDFRWLHENQTHESTIKSIVYRLSEYRKFSCGMKKILLATNRINKIILDLSMSRIPSQIPQRETRIHIVVTINFL